MKIIQEQNVTEIQKVIEACDSAFGSYELPLSLCTYYFDFTKKLSKYSNFYVAIENGICGYAAVYVNDSISQMAYLTLLAVRPDKQKMGIGKLLMRSCVQCAKDNGMEKMRLEVKKKNEQAIRFYMKCGFQFEKQASDDSVYMFMNLH